MDKETSIADSTFIPMNELVYWIDKWFVQERAKMLYGRGLSEDEMRQVIKCIEWGLSESSFDIIDIAINEVVECKDE